MSKLRSDMLTYLTERETLYASLAGTVTLALVLTAHVRLPWILRAVTP